MWTKLLTAATATLAVGVAAAEARADKITLRADVWCPYNCEPGSDKPGILIEIAKAALEPAGHQVEYATLNWARAIVDSRAGTYTGIVGAAKSDAPDFTFPGNALAISKNCFYTKQDSKWEYKGVDSLNGVTIGIIKDYSYDEEVIDPYIKANDKDPKKVDVVSGDNGLELNLKKLAAGRIGAFIEDENVLKSYFFTKKQQPNVKSVGCVKESELFVAFSPKTAKGKELAKLISDKVEAMRKDGSLKTVLAKYGAEDWKK